MIILLLISTMICFGYIAYIGLIYHVASISASYYKMEESRRGMGRMFTLWAILSALTVMPCWLMVSDGYSKLIVYACVITLVWIGLCPDFKGKNRISHPLLNAVCSLLACLWCLIYGTVYIPITLMFISTLICLIMIRWRITLHHLASVKTLFWVETSAFIGIYVSIWLRI